jgi:hypothetical protein
MSLVKDGTGRSEPVYVNVYGVQESIPPAYVAWRLGTTNRVVVPPCQAENRFLGSLKGLQIRARGTCSKLKNKSLFLPYSTEAVKALNKKYGLYGSLGDQVSHQPTVQHIIETIA